MNPRMMVAPRLALLLAISILVSVTTAACGTSSKTVAATTSRASRATKAGSAGLTGFADARQVAAAVRAGLSVTQLTGGEASQLQSLAAGGGIGASLGAGCPSTTTAQESVDVARCTFGDTSSSKTIVLVGDSRAAMWFNVLDRIAIAAKFKLIALGKNGCPAVIGNFRLIEPGGVPTRSAWPACTAFHGFVLATIKKLAPQVVVDSSTDNLYLVNAPGAFASASQVQTAFASFLKAIPAPTKAVVLGGFPNPGASSGSPDLCLSQTSDVSKCSFTVSSAQASYNAAEEQAARQAGAGFIDQNPWFCAARCPAVIAGMVPYTVDGVHAQWRYARYLTGVLWTALKPYLKG